MKTSLKRVFRAHLGAHLVAVLGQPILQGKSNRKLVLFCPQSGAVVISEPGRPVLCRMPSNVKVHAQWN